MIGGRSIQTGDAIGLFYQVTPNVWACGGFADWNGSDLNITVWGDNLGTTIKDGFANNENYTFRVWDDVAQTEYSAIATYASGPDNFQANTTSVLSSLLVNVPTQQDFNLPAGWNMISSYLNITQPALNDIFAEVSGNIIIMKNGMGQNYVPFYNINQIGNWNTVDGYMIKLNAPTQFSLTGTAVTPETTPIALDPTWNMISYLRTMPIPVANALTSLGSTVIIAKNGLGQMYVPAYGINQIGNMNPGEGYYINVNTAESLIYPANGFLRAITGEELSPMPKHLIPIITRTGNNASLILNIDAEDNNEIGIYNRNEELIGSGVVSNGKAAITIWGDDPTTQTVEGASENDLLTATILNTANGNASNIRLSDIREIISGNSMNQFLYHKDALLIANAQVDELQNNVSVNVDGALNVNIMPNPFATMTSIAFVLPEAGNATIDVYSLQGDKVANDAYKAGVNTLSFNGSNLASGVYNLVVRFGTQQMTKLMIIAR
jgi:hypothetical protein